MNNRKKLKEILKDVDVKRVEGSDQIQIDGVSADSKSVKENFIFIAVSGSRFDGHSFIKEALNNGAKAVVCQDDLGAFLNNKDITKIFVSDTRQAGAEIINNFYDRPADKMKVIAITGTNGKTTISYLAESIFKEAGFNVGVIGTVNYRYGIRQIPATNTTPGFFELAQIFNNMAVSGVNCAVMEVSSHSLVQKRVWGINFGTAVFSNITPEHLDYHKNMQEYKKAKSILFDNLSEKSFAVLNIDDDFGKELAGRIKSPVISYGLGINAGIHPEKFRLSSNGIEAEIVTPKGTLNLSSKLVGKFNLYNIMASIGIGIAENIDLALIARGIEKLQNVPGRLQEVSCGQPFKVFVDYAHTDDALKNVLTALRETTKGKLITLFGCGGDRDQAKRPRMSKVVSELSDFAVVTTDNPRGEEPETIIKQVMKGVPKDKLSKFFVVSDRRQAIKKAVSLASGADIVLLAGKGHETYQIFKNIFEPFDDREIAKKALNTMGYVEKCLPR